MAIDFTQVAEGAFDDLLVLRQRVLEYRAAFKEQADSHHFNATELEDILVRCDTLNRTEATARTLDISCHPLNFVDENVVS